MAEVTFNSWDEADVYIKALPVDKVVQARKGADGRIVVELSDYAEPAPTPVNEHKHPSLLLYLGKVTPDHQLASSIDVFIDGDKVHHCVEARDGENGYVIERVCDSVGTPAPGPVTREREGHVQFFLHADSGLTADQIRQLQDSRNSHVVDKSKIQRAKPEDIAACFAPKKRRVQRFNSDDV